MDISLLKTFLEVSKTRHFGKAADNLFVTQSAVSARIKQLEEDLSVELFVRKRNDIQLTPAGNRLHKHAANIVKGWERIHYEVALDPDISGSLAIGSIFDLWSIFVGKGVSEARKMMPDTALQIEILSADTLIQRLAAGTLDMAFLLDPPQIPELEIKQVATLPLVLVSTSENQALEVATGENYILVDWGATFNMLHAEQYPDLPAPMLRTNSATSALDLLEQLNGAAYLPEQMVSQHLEKGDLYSVNGAPVIDRASYVAFRPESSTSSRLLQAIDIIASS